MSVERAQFAFLGYVVSHPPVSKERDDGSCVEFISICPCVADLLITGCLRDQADTAEESRATVAARYGCSPAQLAELEAAAMTAMWNEEIVASQFVRTADALTSLLRFLPGTPDLRVLGAALPLEHLAGLSETLARGPSGPGGSIVRCLEASDGVPEGGVALGFELLVSDGFDVTDHSWTCNGIDAHARGEGVALTAYGLLERRADADDWAAALNRGDFEVERGVWFPWLLLDYTRMVATR